MTSLWSTLVSFFSEIVRRDLIFQLTTTIHSLACTISVACWSLLALSWLVSDTLIYGDWNADFIADRTTKENKWLVVLWAARAEDWQWLERLIGKEWITVGPGDCWQYGGWHRWHWDHCSSPWPRGWDHWGPPGSRRRPPSRARPSSWAGTLSVLTPGVSLYHSRWNRAEAQVADSNNCIGKENLWIEENDWWLINDKTD